MARQGEALLKLGPRAVLMKGGHLDGDDTVDLLVPADAVRRFAAPRLASRNLHGTGCTLSSAIAANIVLGGRIAEAVAGAKAFVRQAIAQGRARHAGRRSRAFDPDRAPNETLTRPVRIRVWPGASREQIGRICRATSTRPFRRSTILPRR